MIRNRGVEVKLILSYIPPPNKFLITTLAIIISVNVTLVFIAYRHCTHP